MEIILGILAGHAITLVLVMVILRVCKPKVVYNYGVETSSSYWNGWWFVTTVIVRESPEGAPYPKGSMFTTTDQHRVSVNGVWYTTLKGWKKI